MNKFCLNIIILFLFGFSFSNDPLAVVTKSKGEVDYKKFDTSVFESSKRGMSIFNTDFFQTGSDGYFAFLYLDDGTLIRVHKNSELFIEGKIDNNAIKKRVNVDNGAVRFDVKDQKGEEFTVITPTSVASVKGTDFFLNTDGIEDKFYGFEGMVEILNKESNSIVNLSRNTKITSLPDGTINIEPITSADLNLIQEIQSSSGEEIEIPIEPGNDNQNIDDIDGTGINDEENDEIKEMRITVQTSTGEQKEIIIRYTD